MSIFYTLQTQLVMENQTNGIWGLQYKLGMALITRRKTLFFYPDRADVALLAKVYPFYRGIYCPEVQVDDYMEGVFDEDQAPHLEEARLILEQQQDMPMQSALEEEQGFEDRVLLEEQQRFEEDVLEEQMRFAESYIMREFDVVDQEARDVRAELQCCEEKHAASQGLLEKQFFTDAEFQKEVDLIQKEVHELNEKKTMLQDKQGVMEMKLRVVQDFLISLQRQEGVVQEEAHEDAHDQQYSRINMSRDVGDVEMQDTPQEAIMHNARTVWDILEDQLLLEGREQAYPQQQLVDHEGISVHDDDTVLR